MKYMEKKKMVIKEKTYPAIKYEDLHSNIVWYETIDGDTSCLTTLYRDKEYSIKFAKWLLGLSDKREHKIKRIIKVVSWKEGCREFEKFKNYSRGE